MVEITLKQNSLLLYKNKPARLVKPGVKKIEIDVAESGAASVRPKDVVQIHPGPLQSLTELRPVTGDVTTAWELLAGETTNLEELAELAFSEFTPATAWAVWQLVEDGLYFYGTPEAVQVRTQAEVTQIKTARAEKEAEEEAWAAFLARLQENKLIPEDGRFLQDLIPLATDQSKQSKVLNALNQAETRENAHALLLKIGQWDESHNPYPARIGVTTRSPEFPLDDLPPETRRDLTHLPAFAIDDEGSTDPDDALSWQDGRLWVHIADVAALAPPDSLADLEARGRGANLYLPEGTITMLPPKATALLGLGLQEKSPALSFGFTVSEIGEISNLEIVPSWVCVTRLTYAEVETRLDEEPFRSIFETTQVYERRRQENGAIDIDLPEIRIKVNEMGQVEIRPLLRLRSRDMVRDAMLMTGEAVARYAFEQGLPLPYTTQDAPTEPLEPAETPSQFFARRRLMSPSRQSTQPGAHAGLGMGFYAQATSPLRRYLDLVVHQQLRAHITGSTPLDEQELMERVGAAGAVSGDVRTAERLSNRHWTMVYLLQNPDWTGESIVIEKRGRKDVILIPELDLETRISMKGERPLDSTVQLTLTGVDLPNLEAFFSAK
ncbi:MAG: RNB domain-containing ribonuclease [Anaerolineae bacterium]|nr:RNB domain-containing ribonuclease [Anaerolineae bacterium]